ncbi:MAG: fimbrillin family protein [Bacteroides xylanisolvens]
MIMNNNLFKTLLIPAAACLLGACAESADLDMETGGESGAIRFAGPAVTRAAINGTADMQTEGRSFSVWGNYTDEEGSTPTSVFTAETVTYVSGMWGYEGTRYWLPGNTYDFYALYPSVKTLGSNVTSVACTDGNFVIDGFDATQGIDLMTAEQTGISVVQGQAEAPGPVALTFHHLLARISFTARSEGGNATVHSISLGRLAVKGDYNSSASTQWSNTETGTISVVKETVVLPGEDADVSGDLLLIPQSLTGGVTLTVTYDTDAEKEKTASYTLPTATVSEWTAANRYRYSFTLTGGGYIVFDPPTVNAWSDATGGNVTIDVTE